MSLRLKLTRLSLAAALAAPGLISGCGGDDAKTPEAQEAQKATGVKSADGTEKTSQKTRNVIVEKDVKVTDPTTGEVLSETKESTPVKITEQTKVVKDVKVDVGDTKTTGDAPAATPPK